ncbi:isoleucyl-tRNA ligase [Halosimplex carlsbadense 2-9-1]|uniref:Isoleucine--tRNA ligase n=1 Tax=Halosimplex carlsbadense 2-9-1 TaxID=797114 RepID=M0CY64_9EURY|nr:isoleucine--tRNA ligase [Halosimplex carlsbadense]ELZ26834.1 isoleucyl-tRNA ligase [Halosimplex carlsbadense 2-9-1]
MSTDDADGDGTNSDRERFGDVPDQYDPDAVEERVFDYWDAVDAYERTVEHRADGEDYFFVDGPPYTSGSAHMGTTWNKTLKDCYLRYLRMQGYDVTDRPGYDMHGLPIETRVEERLDFENKKDIEAFGEDAFIEECKAYADEQLEGLQSDFQSFGVWMDWDDPYKTVEPEYMEAAWWGFEQAHQRGLVEQGQRSISQCPRCETAIANNEVEYEDVEDPSVYVKFDLREADHGEASERASGDGGPASGGREGSLVIWTTTPWTIPANTFVAVDGEGEYVGVDAERDGETERLYVAKPKVESVLSTGRYDDYEVVEELTGEDLVGWSYEHPLREEVPEAPDSEGALEVYTGDYVDTEGDGTGLVHSAPGHGEEDFDRGTELGLDIFCPVGADGVYGESAGAYAGEFVKDADRAIIDDLDANGALLAEETTTHSYGHCWRCDTGIIQIVTDQWFITVTDIKEELLENIEDSEWHPQWARDNRFRDFVEDAPDWNVSRQRYWGIPIPIWIPEEWSGEMSDAVVVGDREELADRVDQAIDPDDVDLHKDTVDDLTITEDGVTYERVPDVFDVWLDSSVATWGTLNYPEDDSRFDELWPADLIMEAHDQTRGWFWSQLGMSTAATGEIPYKQVLMHGYANMPDGRGMSKSKGILVDPHEVIEEYGVDPMRLFLLSVTAQGEDMNFSWDETQEMQRRLNILWNVARFPLPYMRADDFDPDAVALADVEDDLELVDEWVLSRLQTVEAEMTDAMEDFENDRAVNALIDFVVEDVSRFYIQVVRERMWDEADSPSKRAAYATLYTVLEEVAALFAPFTPFVAEEVYGSLTGDAGHPTVHMCDWPEPEDRWRDVGLEGDIEVVRAVEEAGSNARQQAERKLRWPVKRVVVDVDDAGDEADATDVAGTVELRADILADRLNARGIEVVGPDGEWGELTYSAEADMSLLGPEFGDDAGRVMGALNDARVAEPTVEALESAVAAALDESVDLDEEMVEFVRHTPDGVAGAEFAALDSEGVVYVDTTLTEGIESEGYAREVVRRVQEMRKELDLDMEASIRLEYEVRDDRVADLVAEHADLIADEVRATEVGEVAGGHRKTWEVEGIEVEIAITPVAAAEASD